ncbi:MAG: hypothetical protein HQM02_01600 [Magnetococcales bacterium]|nr:hypothetical protein [Magnetococcales bacterium]
MNHSQIHQLQASYSQEQDRVLLRINTSDHAEFRFWLTRRFVQRFWRVLRNHLENQHQIAGVDPNSRAALLEFMHHSATSQTDFDAPYQETADTVTPLGREPIVVTQAGIRPVPDSEELSMVSLHPEEGYGIELAMDTQLMHGFCKLLADAMAHSEWDLDLGFAHIPRNEEVITQGGQLLH